MKETEENKISETGTFYFIMNSQNLLIDQHTRNIMEPQSYHEQESI